MKREDLHPTGAFFASPFVSMARTYVQDRLFVYESASASVHATRSPLTAMTSIAREGGSRTLMKTPTPL